MCPPAALLAFYIAGRATTVPAAVRESKNVSAAVVTEMFASSKHDYRCNVVTMPRCPVSILLAAALHPSESVRGAVASNPSLPQKALRRLGNDGSGYVRIVTAGNPLCDPDLLDALAQNPAEEGLCRAVAANPSCSFTTAMMLAQYGTFEVRKNVAANRSSGAAVLEALSKDRSRRVLEALARNELSGPAVLGRLAGNSDGYLRSLVAQHPQCDDRLLLRVAESGAGLEVCISRAFEDPDLLAEMARVPPAAPGIARSAKCPPRLLSELAQSVDVATRRAVAVNPHTPAETLAALSSDIAGVRAILPYNASTPQRVLHALATDPEAEVRQNLAGSRVCPTEAIAVLAADSEPEVRYAAGWNSRCPPAVSRLLARDHVASVRGVVAGSSSAPEDVLALLTRDEVVDVRKAVASNSDCPAAVLAVSGEDRFAAVRAAAASNPASGRELLARLARDDRLSVRFAVAGNSSCDETLLQELAEDPESKVRTRAASAIKGRSG